MAIIWSGLAPHPPIIVASVGGARCSEVRSTILSMEALSRDLIDHEPDRLVVISPHSPRPQTGIAAWLNGSIHGDFSQFGAPETRLELQVDSTFLKRFAACFSRVVDLGDQALDHGAMVPLHFLKNAGWRGPTAVLGLSWDEAHDPDRIGRALSEASRDERRTAILASGDMSHCLKPGAPAGYDERGGRFDAWFVRQIQAFDYKIACNPEPELKSAACQDVVESCRIAWRAHDYRADNAHFYSYEGPFGVGYAVMRFLGEPP